ncbi:MAG: hypothetical protein DCC57_09025 [Chloroflexi bacterium]|nr:MAG: hypothetical protein DCC57_09025 [Chloroflexota bacterium]
MNPNELIAHTLAAAATALRHTDAAPEVQAAYAAVKTYLQEAHPTISLAALERRPDSANQRGSLAENLEDAGAGQDAALLDVVHALVLTLAQQIPSAATGVDLDQVKAASLRLQSIRSSGAGARIHNSEFTGNMELSDIQGAGSPQMGAPSTQFSHVSAGGNINITYGAQPPGNARRRYLEEVAQECNLLPWRIVNPNFADPDRSANLTLADIYTDLDTTELRQVEQEEELRHFLRGIHQQERIPIQQIADDVPKLLIMGDPGSGKSTYIKHLAYTLAQAGLTSKDAPAAQPPSVLLDPWAHGFLLPVRIELRQVAAFAAKHESDTGDAHLFLRYLEAMLAGWGLAGFWTDFTQTLRTQEPRVLFLLDGLDEVATAQRQLVVDMVNDLCQRYGQHRYLVTCRPYAYIGQPWRLADFRTVTLAPFSQAQIDRFVDNWYNRLAHRERLDATGRKQALQSALRRPDLHELAERPLLLTVMVQLHTFTGQLPDDRGQLYADTVNLLLQRWETRHDQGVPLLQQLAVPGLKMADVEAALYDVAYRAHAQQPTAADTGAADIDEADLRKWLAPYLQGDWNKAGRFIDYIRERAGLLIRHKTEAYTFPHRTFQEYLAACSLIRTPDYPTTASDLVRQDPTRWREVFLLSVSRAPLGQALAAVNALCSGEVDTAAPAPAWQTAQLAGDALLEIGRIQVEQQETGHVLLTRLRRWLAQALRQDQLLSPHERAGAGRTLARLGDCRPAVLTVEEMEFCFVPAGPFLMGSTEDDELAQERERPQHEVNIPYDYWIARFPVTNAQFDHFVHAGGYDHAPYWPEAAAVDRWDNGAVTRYYLVWNEDEKKWEASQETTKGPHTSSDPFNLPNHPRVELTWYEALAFTRWFTGHLRRLGYLPGGYEVHLPSEAEWEKAARGGLHLPVGAALVAARDLAAACDTGTATPPVLQSNPYPARLFPWGDEYAPNRLNASETGLDVTSAVGAFPAGAGPYGAEDLSGNTFEWTRTLWGTSADKPDFAYPYRSGDGREDLAANDSTARIMRGGAWAAKEWQRSAARVGNSPGNRHFSLGFRCVVVPISRASF